MTDEKRRKILREHSERRMQEKIDKYGIMEDDDDGE